MLFSVGYFHCDSELWVVKAAAGMCFLSNVLFAFCFSELSLTAKISSACCFPGEGKIEFFHQVSSCPVL